jgi:hypothetical protein
MTSRTASRSLDQIEAIQDKPVLSPGPGRSVINRRARMVKLWKLQEGLPFRLRGLTAQRVARPALCRTECIGDD